MRVWLRVVDRRDSEELFMLNILLVTLGLAWVTEHAGLSMAMGAFMSGMLIAETDYKHRVEEDIRPFHDVLLGLFFITLGMKLDWHVLQLQWPWVLVLAVIPVVVKAVLIGVLAYIGGAGPTKGSMSGVHGREPSQGLASTLPPSSVKARASGSMRCNCTGVDGASRNANSAPVVRRNPWRMGAIAYPLSESTTVCLSDSVLAWKCMW